MQMTIISTTPQSTPVLLSATEYAITVNIPPGTRNHRSFLSFAAIHTARHKKNRSDIKSVGYLMPHELLMVISLTYT